MNQARAGAEVSTASAASPRRTRRASTATWDALLVCVAAFMLIAMARVHAVVPGIAAIRPAILIGVLCLALYFGSKVRERAIHHLKHPLAWLALGFFFWAALGAPFGLYPGNSVRFIFGNMLRVAILFMLVAAVVRNLHDVRRLLMTLAIGGMVFALFATGGAFRAVGGGGYDPNDSAMFIASTIPIGVYFALRERRYLYKALFVIGLMLCVVAIVRTGSRGGFLAFAAVTAYILVFFKGVKPVHRLISVVAVVGIMGVAANTQYWDTIRTIQDPNDYNLTSPTGRKAIWERARGYMVQHPVFGVGVMNFSVAEGQHPMIAASIARGRGFKYSAAHSMWYQVGAETGFPGLALFVGVFGLSIFYLRRLIRIAKASPHSSQLQDTAGYASAIIGSILALMVSGTFLSNAYWAMVWGPVALALGLLKVMRFQGIDVVGGKARTRPVTTTGHAPRRALHSGWRGGPQRVRQRG